MYYFSKRIAFLLLTFGLCTQSFSQTIWYENFTGYTNGDDSGGDNNTPTGVDWTTDYTGVGTFSVQNAEFEASGMNGEGSWTSEVIDISVSNYVEVNVDAAWLMSGVFTGSDYIRMYYRLDGGPEQLFFEQVSGFLSFGGSATASRILSGSNLQIVIRINTDDIIVFDNIAVTEVPVLYSRANGTWSNGNTWSADDFSGTQVACGCIPTASEVAVVGNGNIVNITSASSAGALVVENSGTLRWTGNANLDIASGLVDVQTGGTVTNNGRTANMRFNNTFSASLNNSGSYTITNLVLPVQNTELVISGNSSINILGDIAFQQNNIILTNNSTGGVSTGRIFFDQDNSTFLNNTLVLLSGNIEAGSGDNGNVISNSASGTIDFSGISLTNSNLTINNSGIINQSGNFVSGTIDAGSSFNNLNGATWNWSHVGAAYDPSVNDILDCADGVNTFNYNGTGVQSIISADYSNLTVSGVGAKSVQANLDVNRDLYITGSAQLSQGANNINLAGDWTNDSGNANPFNAGNGTVVFDGSSDQTITAVDTEGFSGITVNKGGGAILLAADVQVDGSLSLTNGNINLGVQNITVSASGSISGGSSSSFIVTNNNGYLTQSNIGAGGKTGAIIFPVGVSASSYTPLLFDNSAGVADDFSINMCDRINPNGDCGAAGTSAEVVNRMWFIEEATLGGSNATITLQWTTAEELTDFDRTNVNVLHYDGAEWEVMSTAPADGVGPFTASASGITSFSPFGVESAEGAPLPVDLLYFKAQPVAGAVDLLWTTASELNNDYYTVERTIDLEQFEEVAVVQGKGTTEMKNSYQATDLSPINGVSYYRLKQTDYDGTFRYYDLIQVNYNQISGNDKISIYPVPGNGQYINFVVNDMNGQDEVPVEIFNVHGKSVYQSTFLVGEQGTVKLEFEKQLPAGYYTLRINGTLSVARHFLVK